MQPCIHLDQINDVEPSAQGCEECLQTGDTWVHLRECLTCGHVGCCDFSKSVHLCNTELAFWACITPGSEPEISVSL